MADRPKLSAFRHDYLGLDVASIKRSLANRLIYSTGKDPDAATPRDWFHTAAYVVRDRLAERWIETVRSYYREDAKRVYYLSLEFLLGRVLINNLLNMDMLDECRAALAEIGLDLGAVAEQEPEAALGNGGLGRLAACFLDSMATLRLPGYGYGIRYEYGMFYQRIEDGQQVEHPENWLRYGNPWEFPRPEIIYPVQFYGRVEHYRDEHGVPRHRWVDAEQVMAMAYDTPITGYGTNTVNSLRLWSAKATRDFEFKYFNEGNYIKAVQDKTASENLSRVLYPDDTTAMGRELRLKQEYFFVSASLQDILHRYREHHDAFDALPDKIAIQLNDTHPAIAIPELMRLLMDLHGLPWERAWDLTTRCFSYTNHTLLPEAMETWPVRLLEAMLPRHMQIIYEINQRFLDQVRQRLPDDAERLRRMSLIDEQGERRVRMAYLAVAGSHAVNGVSQVHTGLMRSTLFADFQHCYPDKIINITNGVTPRRWLRQINPALAELISSRIGRGWITDLTQLGKLAPLAEDAAFRAAFRAAKRANKERLAGLIQNRLGIEVSADALFDVHVKRIHEYKRQVLKLLHAVTLYHRLRTGVARDPVPRAVIFSGKAAPGYTMAKLVIKLINDVAATVNADPAAHGHLKVMFIPNYDVTTAGDIIPAAELSEQISTAGTEASGTGNMKLALNGALTIGTLDGANVEIRARVGEDNIFVFGLEAAQADALLRGGYDPQRHYRSHPELKQALDLIASGHFSPREPERFQPLINSLLHADRYLVLADFADYLACQERVETLYRDAEAWTRKAIINVAGIGEFSSDRAVREYAERVWQARPVAHE
ncbi:MAG: glycogen/starch/alpha-glucan phosphorylase [Gammaproteobacteria bacterium]|nr:glycogen/starch/alpha-glucan phosphorylase [Gammaproteobacteria bacterium]